MLLAFILFFDNLAKELVACIFMPAVENRSTSPVVGMEMQATKKLQTGERIGVSFCHCISVMVVEEETFLSLLLDWKPSGLAEEDGVIYLSVRPLMHLHRIPMAAR